MPQPHPVAFTIFHIDIMWYSIMICIGLILGGYLIVIRAPKHQISQETSLTFMLIIVPMAIIGARFYYVIFNLSLYQGDIFAMINTRNGGLAIHGALIFGIATACILCHIGKIRPLNLLDLFMPSIALGQCIGRWGNYFNSEAHGGPTDLPWAVWINGESYHPTFLYESIWCFLLFIVLILIDRNRKFEGQVALLYGILYSLERFFVESLRTDSLMLGSFKQAQLLSATVIVLCIIAYIVLNKKAKKTEHDD